ncbi:MAG: hypothetical protein MI919_18275, partial [Holophagales bacterium]|nr:hypothetical protein [Holophagales bacterium]
MWHLIKSELLRFRAVAVALAVGVLLLLRGSMSIYPLFAADAAKTSITLLVCVVLGLSLGLYQLGSYRPSGQWTYLIHRPLGPKRIFLALAGAGLCLIFFVLVLPVLLMTAYLELAGSQWVDSRHYLLGPYLFGLTAAFYFAGAFIVLSRSRAAFLAVGITVFFLTREAEGAWIFVPQALVLLWLGGLCLAAFKPDLSTHVKKPWAVAAGTLALGYAFFWCASLGVGVAYSMGVIVKEHGIFGLSTFAWNDYFPPGTSEYVGYQNGRGALAHGLDPEALAAAGLEGEALANARHLQAQTALAEVFEVPGPRIARYPVRHQLLFSDQRHELVDDEAEVLWLFSHDLMLFQGIDVRSGEGVGWMGLDGPVEGSAPAIAAESRFPEVPVVVG